MPGQSDTPSYIHDILIEGYRRMSPGEKLARASEMTVAVQQLALARIKKQHGQLPEREQLFRLASLWLERDILTRAFNWDPGTERT